VEPFVLRNVVVDCAEPRALAEFYRVALGWSYVPGHEENDPAGDDWLQLRPPEGGPLLAFQRSDAPVTAWRADARVHIDVTVPDLDLVHEHLLACGARPLTGTPEDEGHPEDPFRVYADPAGHPFCVAASRR
jgi:catechol 2,3-dioxygenase-like lactoylglutathione lyase family enzyme